ncbi:MAG: hypothetical protein WCJ33_01720 [Pseudomonadota bacterium]
MTRGITKPIWTKKDNIHVGANLELIEKLSRNSVELCLSPERDDTNFLLKKTKSNIDLFIGDAALDSYGYIGNLLIDMGKNQKFCISSKEIEEKHKKEFIINRINIRFN